MSSAVVQVNENTQIKVSARFTPAGQPNTPMDPSAIRLKTRAPGAATVTTYSVGDVGSPIVHDGAGLFHAFLTLSTPGPWWISWVGEGAGGPIVVGEIMVRVLNAVNV